MSGEILSGLIGAIIGFIGGLLRMTQQESVKKSNECKSGNDNATTANQKAHSYSVQVTPIE